MLGFVKIMSGEFRDPYTLRTPNVSLMRPKLEYASYVWRPCYDSVGLSVCRVRTLNTHCENWRWTDMHDLSPYVDQCALIFDAD
jgi:hypothetical protein